MELVKATLFVISFKYNFFSKMLYKVTFFLLKHNNIVIVFSLYTSSKQAFPHEKQIWYL